MTRPPSPPQYRQFSRVVPRGKVGGPRSFERRGLARAPLLSDLFHFLMDTTWPRLFAVFVLGYVGVNAGFALLYVAGGDSIVNAEPGNFEDAFFFSVQTMATIGYGVLAPKTTWAHALVAIEALVGMLGIAMSTGLMFAKFSRARARVLFSRVAVVARRDGVPTLSFRVANEREATIAEAHLQLTLVRWEMSKEGERMRRFHDLALARSSTPVFALSWTVMHPLDATSPLHGATHEDLVDYGAEIIASFSGMDEASGQVVHERFSWVAEEVQFGARLVDIFVRQPDGKNWVDYTRFHDWEPEPTPVAAQAPVG